MNDVRTGRNLPDIRVERSNASILANRNLTEQQLLRWRNCLSAHRFLAYSNKEVVVFNVAKGVPNVLNTLVCVEAGFTLSGGLTSQWETDTDGVVELSHTPFEVGPNCFMWHAFDSQIRYFPYAGTYSANFPMVYRTKSNPNKINEDHVYMLERSAYNAKFGG